MCVRVCVCVRVCGVCVCVCVCACVRVCWCVCVFQRGIEIVRQRKSVRLGGGVQFGVEIVFFFKIACLCVHGASGVCVTHSHTCTHCQNAFFLKFFFTDSRTVDEGVIYARMLSVSGLLAHQCQKRPTQCQKRPTRMLSVSGLLAHRSLLTLSRSLLPVCVWFARTFTTGQPHRSLLPIQLVSFTHTVGLFYVFNKVSFSRI